MTNVDVCEKEQEKCYELNVAAVNTLIQICQQYNIRLIHLSTDFIFDGLNGPYSETDKPNPLSFYGKSKWEAEQLLINSSCSFAIIRTIIVYGVANEMSRSNIVLWAKAALENGEEICVVDDQWRMPTLAEDLAECCLLAVSKEAQGIFNVSGKDMMNMVELTQRVAQFWNLNSNLIKPISSKELQQAAPRPAKTGFILDKAITELGYRPHSFEEGLAVVAKQLTN
jgi:dTDP-4-dehydrorhamnose reductase